MSVDRARVLLVDLLYKEYLGDRAGDMVAEALSELQPEPRIIDWQKVVDNRLPVSVTDVAGATWLAFLYDYHPEQHACFWTGSFWTAIASLETGQWVFNSMGENPWPDGVLVECWTRGGLGPCGNKEPAKRLRWARRDSFPDILASRAVGLEPGYTYFVGDTKCTGL